jgi:uncharacterized protein (TIGR02611 family)
VSEEGEGRRREPPKLVKRLQAQRATHKDRHIVVRGVFLVAGVTLLFGGLAMLVLPGPAFVVIPIGLALLSLEFAWAGRLLDKSLDKAAAAAQKAEETTTTERILVGVAVALAVGAAVFAVIAWDLPGPL